MPHAPTRFTTPLQRSLAVIALSAATLGLAPAHADTGKLLLTGGVSTVDGAAGGGLSPWAVIGGPGAEGQTGAAAYVSRAVTRDYGLTAAGVAIGLNDRVELSFGHQDFNTRATGTALGLPGLHLKQDVLGAKWRMAGDAIVDSDTLMPQIAVGVQHKRLQSSGLDGTLRATRANQGGLLGHGATLGGADDGYELVPEVSVAWLLRKDLAVGLEYRAMPNKLQRAGAAAGLGNGLRADDWMDLFVAWTPSKNVSLTAAWVNLGRIVPATTAGRQQTGFYTSAQFAF